MRVGIVSIYYNAFNYGAQLQARALVQIVKEYGYECEQICYDATDERAGANLSNGVKVSICSSRYQCKAE